MNYSWREFQSAVLKKPGDDDLDPWAPVVQALDSVPFTIYIESDPRFYLAGGTALALQIGHRTSLDLDFYTKKSLNL